MVSVSRIRVGSRVLLVVPENSKLDRTVGVVLEITDWGAYISSVSSATGRFRALFSEMALFDESNGVLPPVVSISGVSKSTSTNGKDNGYTGNSCNICGSVKMIRSGVCEVCQDCGSSSGCG
jgi:hypothetical protein